MNDCRGCQVNNNLGRRRKRIHANSYESLIRHFRNPKWILERIEEECETHENLEQLPRFQLIKDASEIAFTMGNNLHKLDLYSLLTICLSRRSLGSRLHGPKKKKPKNVSIVRDAVGFVEPLDKGERSGFQSIEDAVCIENPQKTKSFRSLAYEIEIFSAAINRALVTAGFYPFRSSKSEHNKSR